MDAYWEQIKDTAAQAQSLGAEERARFLDEACGSDAAMRAEVESLLLAESASFSSSLSGAAFHEVDADADLASGQLFCARYRLIRRLGEGGMGQVWLAEQLLPVQRRVALKLIRAGMYDEKVVQRFQSERQSLAIMDHPAIAKVFDAGSTPQGQPYFVMEYVPGLPITEYCDQQRLTIRDRLELLIQACDGVQHAHQKAIIHRDLKPANILIMDLDGKAVPRIIDFGLAKPTTPRVADQTVYTRLGQFIGTPGFMSPEQVDPDIQDIDTRTDVYSLGVILYVLLTGLQPFETKRRQRLPLDEWMRQLREEEPPYPSVKLGKDLDGATAASTARQTDPKRLVSMLRGDLDWIALKALDRDRERRYGTASELAADLRRYLSGEPVTAQRAGTVYHLRKYLVRHRVAAAAAIGLMLIIAGFSVVQAIQLHRITAERDRANQERDRAARITDFMTGMFKVSDPGEARGNSITAREILDRASAQMGTALTRDPDVQTQMFHTMAGTYLDLGLLARAHELARRELDARLELLGPNDPRTLESMMQLGSILANEGLDADAEKLERQCLDIERRVLGPEDPQTLETMDALAVALQHQGRYDESEQLDSSVIAAGTRAQGPESVRVMRAMNNLGGTLWLKGRYAEAEQQFRRLTDSERRLLGKEAPETLRAENNLALSLKSQNRLAEAEQMYRELLDAEKRVLGPEHHVTALTMNNLASTVSSQGRWADAEKLNRETLAIQLRTLGPNHAETLMSKMNLAYALMMQGQLRQAEQLQRETLEVQSRALGPDNPDTLLSSSDLALTMLKEKRYAEAESIARRVHQLQASNLGPDHPDALASLQTLGSALAHRNRYEEASRLFREVTDKPGSDSSPGNGWSVWYSFACVAAAANRPDDAIQYLRAAINRGYTDGAGLLAEDDLKMLRGNPKFQQLIAELKHPPKQGALQERLRQDRRVTGISGESILMRTFIPSVNPIDAIDCTLRFDAGGGAGGRRGVRQGHRYSCGNAHRRDCGHTALPRLLGSS